MKRQYRIFIIWFYGKMWLAKTVKYRIEREQWKKIVIQYFRKIRKPKVKVCASNLIVKNFIHKQIRCGGRPIDIHFMEEMFPQK